MSKSLFVGNIAYGAMEREIRELFSQCGTVQQVRFAMDHRKGRFRGFGFVTMGDKEAERAILELDGAEFQDRKLQVKMARTSNSDKLMSA